jgi:hypothetical protein
VVVVADDQLGQHVDDASLLQRQRVGLPQGSARWSATVLQRTVPTAGGAVRMTLGSVHFVGIARYCERQHRFAGLSTSGSVVVWNWNSDEPVTPWQLCRGRGRMQTEEQS